MTLIPSSEIRNVTGITKQQEEDIRIFLQGAIYTWCKNRKDEWFALRDLMGGDNYDWSDTPLQALYDKHIALGKNPDDAVMAAGRDGGWLLKKAINSDGRSFETKEEGLTRKYRWLQP